MVKKSNLFVRHKYMLAFFFLTVISLFIGCGDKLLDGSIITYTFHIVDFSLGFFSRILPGQLYVWLFKNPSYGTFRVYSAVIFFATVFCASYLLEKVYLRAGEEKKSAYLYIICIFCISGTVFHIFYRELGMHDFYWVIALVVFFLLLRNKKTWFLIPLCFAFSIMVNYGVLFCYVPLMSIVLLFEAGSREDKSEKKYLLIVFASCMIVSVLMFAVLLYNEQLGSLTKEQLHGLIESRGSNYYTYFDYAFFRDYHIELGGKPILIQQFELIKSDALPVFLKEAVNRIAYQLYLTFRLTMEIIDYDRNMIKVYSCLALIGVFYVYFYYKSFVPFYRSCKEKLKKFALFCGLFLFWFAFLSGFFFSNDKIRFFHNAVISIFAFSLYLMYKEEKEFGAIVTANVKKTKTLHLALFGVAAFLVRFYPYMD